MLGEILTRLTDPASAEATLTVVSQPALLERVTHSAAEQAQPVGALVADRVGHLLDHGGEQVWLDLLGVMGASPEPGVAAVNRIIALAFPDPTRVRITRNAG